jgi:hypothetical protein
MTRPSDEHEPGRPPDYVIVVAASDWITDRYPAAASLAQALQPGQADGKCPGSPAAPYTATPPSRP